MKRTVLFVPLFLVLAASASAQVHFCVARIDDKGVLHLREFTNTSPRTDEVEGTEFDRDNRPMRKKVKVTHQSLAERTLQLDATAVKAFDGAGKEVVAADLGKKLVQESPVVVLDGGQKPTGALTGVLRKETLVLTVPFSFVALDACCQKSGSVTADTVPVPTPIPIRPPPPPLPPPPPPGR